VLYLPGYDGQEWWLDPSCQECRPGEIPAWIAKHDGLLLDTMGGSTPVIAQFLSVTGTVKNQNRDEHHYQAVIGPKGELDAEVEALSSGRYALVRRIEQHAASSQFFVEEARRQVVARLPTAQVVTQRPTECDDHDGLCRRRVRFTAPEYATFDGDRMLVPLMLLVPEWDRSAESEKRHGDIQVESPTHDEESVDLTVPAGWVLDEVPGAEHRHSGAADVAFEVSCREGHVAIRRSIDTHEGMWDRSAYGLLREVVRGYAAVRQKALVFRRDKDPQSGPCGQVTRSLTGSERGGPG
jgi:hypothetical protein